MVQSGSKRFDFCRKCINFSPAGGCGSGLHGSEFPHHIHGQVQCLHLLHMLPAHRVLFPVLEAERQRGGALQLRAILVFGFWIRIRIGLDWIGLRTHVPSYCWHLLSAAVRWRHLLFYAWILWCSSHLGSRNTACPHLAEPDHVQACHGIHGSFITKMVLPNKWYMER